MTSDFDSFIPGDGYTRPGDVRISPAALQLARDFREQVAQSGFGRDWVVCFDWANKQAVREKGETEWRELGPGLGIGACKRHEVGDAFIQKVDDMEIAIQIPPEVLERSAERLIDTDEQALFKLTLR